ncbi:MAG: hypothetical protein ABI565_09655 [Vicinamibacteria bacterium]
MEVEKAPEPPSPAAPSPGGNRGAAALTVGLLFLFAGAGAASGFAGPAVGIPSAGIFALSALAGVLTWASGVTGLAGFLLPMAAVFVGSLALPSSASLLLFSGRPLFAFALAGLALAAVASGKRPPRASLLPFFFAVYAGVSYEVQSRVGPDGDEPQYLMVCESLIRDHDLVLDQDFKEERYQAFFSRPLAPDFRIRGPQGQIYSLHAVGLSILILPAYALGGYAGASFFMAFLAALLVRELRRFVAALLGDDHLALGTAWLVGLSPPLIHFAGLIFTEIPAALLLCIGLRTATLSRSRRSPVVAALCAAALPWLNVRYSILAAAVVVALGYRLLIEERPRSEPGPILRPLLMPGLVLMGSAIALVLYHHALWGFFDPRRVYGRRREFSLDILPEGLPGLFFDQEFGLLVYAPVFVLSLAGFAPLWRRRRGLALGALLAVGGVIATASVWPMWRGGFNPPARFLVPLVSILAVTLALSLERGFRASTALLVGWSLWCGVFGAMNIETVHRDRDGTAPFFRTQSGAREWTAALPSFVLSQDRATRVLAWPWAALLALPLIGSMRASGRGSFPIRNRDTLLAAAALMTTSVFADHLSPRLRSPERDAVRLVGSPSLLLPSLQVEEGGAASWAMDLFYEPHRVPLGQTFARALSLPAGWYELTLEASDAVPGSPPDLIFTDHRTQKSGRQEMEVKGNDAKSLTARFSADGSDIDLSLIGGGPIAFSRARLRVER